ncbi:hypothetical protein [Spiroplasma endosymbiont of Nebria brevicollis]|uniref:hypothetical protein n=1 Tax=Spiroplasma endosymbiont of Nebria brevicollis TaxID=3066284 RepID=UPI00313BB9A3
MPNQQNELTISNESDTQQLITNQNDNDSIIENKTRKTTIWNTFKNIGDTLIDFSTRQRKTILASHEAAVIAFIGMVEDLKKTSQKLYYNSKKAFFIDFFIKTLSLPIPLGIMLMRSNLPWGEMDDEWLNNLDQNIILNKQETLFLNFNNIPILAFCLLSSSAISKIIIVFLKALNSWKRQNNNENATSLIESNQTFDNNNNLEKIIKVMEKLDFSFELLAMGYMFSFPPSFSKRFNYTFSMIFDNPLFTRIGAGINAFLLIENEFDIYNNFKNYFLKENVSPIITQSNIDNNFDSKVINGSVDSFVSTQPSTNECSNVPIMQVL